MLKTRRMRPVFMRPAFLAAVALCMIALAAVAFWYTELRPIIRHQDMLMDVYVDASAGMNIDTDAIHFGKVPPGATSGRRMLVSGGDQRTQVTFETSGQLSGWVSVSENNFILEPHQNKSVDINLAVPATAHAPDYLRGTLRMTYRAR